VRLPGAKDVVAGSSAFSTALSAPSVLKDARFGAAVLFRACDAVQWSGEIQEHADVGEMFQSAQLKAASIRHSDGCRRWSAPPREIKGVPNISARIAEKTSVFFKMCFDQGSRRRLTVRAGDPD